MGKNFSKPTEDESPSNLKRLTQEQLSELKEMNIPVAALHYDPRLYRKLRLTAWNLDTIGWPAVIVQPKTAEHVSRLVQFAKQHDLEVCVRTAGGHSGHALVTNCLAVDLSLMRQIAVDPQAKTVSIEGGATIGDVDGACQKHNLALVMGQVHHTGVAGMALNATSGVGYLARTRGPNVKHLKSVDLVLASGEILNNVTEESHPDLFWGIRGAGSNFGIVTKLIYRLTAMPQEGVYCGDIVKFPIGEGPPIWNSGKTRLELILNHIRHFLSENTPPELAALLVLAAKGPVVARLAYIPKEEDNDKREENLTKAKQCIAPIRNCGTSLMDTVKMRNYHSDLQKMGVYKSSYYYQKAGNCKGVTEEAFRKLCDLVRDAPVGNMGSAIILQPMGGCLKELKVNELPTANVLSKMEWWIICCVNYPKGKADPDTREKCMTWVQECFEQLEPFHVSAISGPENANKQYCDEVYGNITGGNDDRLVQIKNQFDPDNFFKNNRNVKPTVVASQ